MLARQKTPKSAVPAEWTQPIAPFPVCRSQRNNRAPAAPAAAPGRTAGSRLPYRPDGTLLALPLSDTNRTLRMDLLASIAASRLAAQQRAMEVTADNFANANTPGYKEHRVQFSDWLSRQRGATIAFTQDRATWREPQPGTLSHTGNPLDVALTASRSGSRRPTPG